MSIVSEKTISERIKSASHNSPITVFNAKKYDPDTDRTSPALDAVFANTFVTIDRIKAGDPNFIGTFHGQGGAERFMTRRRMM
jgi:hypothetical protein